MQRLAVLIALCAVTGACASKNDDFGLNGQRSVFSNPYVKPVVEKPDVGPDGDPRNQGPDERSLDGLIYAGSGIDALEPEGGRAPLSRKEHRQLRERAELIRQRQEQDEAIAEWQANRPAPPPPVQPSAPPTSNPPD